MASHVKLHRVEIYCGVDGLWYWRLKAPNGRNVANGSEGYASRRNARRAFAQVVRAIRGRVVEVNGS